jgi:hypothetical protein
MLHQISISGLRKRFLDVVIRKFTTRVSLALLLCACLIANVASTIVNAVNASSGSKLLHEQQTGTVCRTCDHADAVFENLPTPDLTFCNMVSRNSGGQFMTEFVYVDLIQRLNSIAADMKSSGLDVDANTVGTLVSKLQNDARAIRLSREAQKREFTFISVVPFSR